MSASSLPAFLDAFVAALQNRGGLVGVNVFSAPVTPEDLGKEAIELAEEVSVDQGRWNMGTTDIEETYNVTGSVMAFAPMVQAASPQATINACAKTARDRCSAILAEVLDELATNRTMDGTVQDSRIDSQTWHQGMAPEGQLGRACWVEFSVKVMTGITP